MIYPTKLKEEKLEKNSTCWDSINQIPNIWYYCKKYYYNEPAKQKGIRFV